MSSFRRPRTAVLRIASCVVALFCGALLQVRPAAGQPVWGDYGGNAQHTALSSYASQSLHQILWQTPVDLHPQYSGTTLLIHYGCPLVSQANTIVVPVKTGVSDGFRVETHRNDTGALVWQFDTDYSVPPHNWVPSFSPALTPNGRLYMPAAGGTLLYTDDVDAAGAPVFTRVAFYGIANYNSNPAAFAADIKICTPLTSDAEGNVYFGYRALGSNPLALLSGLARIDPSGAGTFVSAVTATGNLAQQVLMNCAPAISNNGQTVYVAMRRTANSTGYLLALDATTLSTTHQTLLVDPKSGSNARLASDGTASPMVAPDDRIYFGVLESPPGSNSDRGWLLQFDAALTVSGAPGAFGWDDTPSLVPASMVQSYVTASPYLLMTKYNFYAGRGGDGVNKLAIVDPNSTQIDTYTGATVMKETFTIAGVTPDQDFLPFYPNAVREWCINTAVADPFRRSILAGSEDGILYRWDLTTNSFTEAVTLTPGIGEAYTPTLIARDGTVYAINNATLFAVGTTPTAALEPETTGSALALVLVQPNPFTGTTTMRFSLRHAERGRLEIVDAGGRRVVALLAGDISAGEHTVHWAGRDARGGRCAAGVYFARLTAGARTATRRVVLLR